MTNTSRSFRSVLILVATLGGCLSDEAASTSDRAADADGSLGEDTTQSAVADAGRVPQPSEPAQDASGGTLTDGGALTQAGEAEDASYVDGPAPDAASPTVDAGTSPEEAPGLVMRDVREEPGAFCRFGGTWHESGLDDGAPSGSRGDARLQAGEVDTRRLACDPRPERAQLAASGLDRVPVNTSCRPPAGPSASTGVGLTAAFPFVAFPQDPDCKPWINSTSCSGAFRPVALRQHPVSHDFYLVQQNGRVLRFAETTAATTAVVALDIADKLVMGYEPGLLSLDFDPAHPEDAFVTYDTCATQREGAIVDGSLSCGTGAGQVFVAVSRFTLDAAGDLDPGSERLFLELPHVAPEHNGGGVMFGPDGYLYVATGDGGGFPNVEAQDGMSLNGKILRVDVHDALGNPLGPNDPAFRVPATNPYLRDPNTHPAVFARGLRNPWRYSFDPSAPVDDPALWVADVGLVTAEEVNLVHAGDNLGWPLMEGKYCRPTGADAALVTVLPDSQCSPSAELILPVHSQRQAFGTSITGGYVYDGSAIPSLRGDYVFADFTLGFVWALSPDTTGGYQRRTLLDSAGLVASFAEDRFGELYVMDWWTGGVSKLTAVNASASRPPALLSQTGCVDARDPARPAPGAIRYDVNVPFFSGTGVYKSRYLYLQPGASLTEYDHTGSLILQPGTVLVKTFETENRKIETRIMYHHADTGWTGWSYRWNDEQTDAVLLDEAKDESFDGLDWHFPEQGECSHCHTNAAGRSLGLRIEQLNGVSYYSQTQRFANQLDTLKALGLIDRVVPTDPSRPISGTNATVVALPDSSFLPAYPALDDASAPLANRVAAYLGSNCSHCHQPGGGGRGAFDLRADHLLSVCNTRTESGVFDDSTMRVIAPGSPQKSMLYRRLVESSLPYSMSPYRGKVDPVGAALIKTWIETDALTDCLP